MRRPNRSWAETPGAWMCIRPSPGYRHSPKIVDAKRCPATRQVIAFWRRSCLSKGMPFPTVLVALGAIVLGTLIFPTTRRVWVFHLLAAKYAFLWLADLVGLRWL